MLRELHISNLAVIEDARIDLRPGLNVFTGQTGAGKSLILGAFELLLGQRSIGNLLRSGVAEGRVSGVFELNDPELVEFVRAVADLDEDDLAPGDSLLMTRKLFESGRSSVSINGRPATLAMLRLIGERLIDLHGGGHTAGIEARAPSPSPAARQNESLLLLRPSYQLDVLDGLAGNEGLRREFADAYAEMRQLRAMRDELENGRTLRNEQIDLLRFQLDEIDRVDPAEGEYDELRARHKVLSSIERLLRDASALHELLYESEGSVSERLQYAVAVLRELNELDSDLDEIRELTELSAANLQDAAFSLGRYVSRLDHDPEESAEVADRLNALNRLISKYGHGSYEGVLAFRREVAARLEELEQKSVSAGELDGRIAECRRALERIAAELRDHRKRAFSRLKPLIQNELRELAMSDAEFDIRFDELPIDHTPAGADEIEFLVRTNPGQPVFPLREIASGGELSRIMLALKSVLAESERVSVLVFDEIDARIGGRLGTVIGTKLRALAERHQVLCITHLPQIAAFANHHLRIVKESGPSSTRTKVTALISEGDRVEELADMLAGSGATSTTRAQAKELLDRASLADVVDPPEPKISIRRNRRSPSRTSRSGPGSRKRKPAR